MIGYLFFLYLSFAFIYHVKSKELCSVSKGEGAKNFQDCQQYDVRSENKVCCYVKGEDEREVSISSCFELPNVKKDALVSLYTSESTYGYFIDADCNMGNTLQICSPNSRKSYIPLSTDICKQYPVVSYTGISDDSRCCYATGVNTNNKNVYTCVRNDKHFYTIKEVTEMFEEGQYKHIGPLKNVQIICPDEKSSNHFDILKFYSFSTLTYILILFSIFI